MNTGPLIKTRCECLVTNVAHLTVNYIELILNPVSQCVAVGNPVTFTAAAEGRPIPTVQWQVSTNGGITWTNIPGATSNSLTFVKQPGTENNLYRAVFTNSCGTVTSASASTSLDPIIITLQPVSVCYVVGDPVTFTADATGYSTVQWQVSTNGGSTWTDLVGETTTSLNFIIAAGQQNNLYRAVFSGECSFDITNTATLFIYNETFTDNDGGYTVLNTGTPTNGGPWIYSAVNDRWEVHGSETGFASALRSPIISIPVNATLALTFNHIYNFQRGTGGNRAGGNVKISINGGAFSLVPLSSFFVNGYNYILSPGFNNPLEGQPAWSGQQLIESASAATLGVFTAGDTLQIEFDGGWGDEALRPSPNWTIDDVTVSCANSIELP